MGRGSSLTRCRPQVSLHVAMTVGEFDTLILGGHRKRYQYCITGEPFARLGDVLDRAANSKGPGGST